jgi:hypothetical protein
MKHAEHLALALQELEGRHAPPLTQERVRRFWTKNREVRKKIRAKRNAKFRVRKWVPLGYLWLLGKGLPVRPPHYYRRFEGLGIRSLAWLIQSAAIMPAVLYFTRLSYSFDDSDQSVLIKGALIYAAVLAFIIITSLVSMAMARKKYQLSTWEELAQADPDQSLPTDS